MWGKLGFRGPDQAVVWIDKTELGGRDKKIGEQLEKKKRNSGLFLTLDIRINFKWIRDQKVKAESTEALEDSMDDFFFNIRKDFLTMNQNAKVTKEKI